MKNKVAFFTLGCKVNFCETESLQFLFEEAGYRVVEFDEPADLYVINTCTVTGQSDHKSRKAIRRARSHSPGALVVVTGCYAQGASEYICRMKEVDLVIGNQGRETLPEIVKNFEPGSAANFVVPHEADTAFEVLPQPGRRGRTRGFLKVQEGCSQGCTYCIVPKVRGPLRSLDPDQAVKQAVNLVQSGCREIVLTGVHLGLYGADLNGANLALLLKKLADVKGLMRLRISSLEPSDITSELVEEIVNSSIICPHLHIPLQSGDGEILRLMNRPYEPVEYLYLAKWLKQEIPMLSLSTDLIVGFPGETERHHRRSMELVKNIGFSSLHVFKYSSRPDTKAADLPGHLPNQVKDERSREMIGLGKDMASAYRKQFIGTVQPVLVEKVVPYSSGEGLTPHYLRVKIKSSIKGLHWRGSEILAHLDKEKDSLLEATHLKRRRR